MTTVVPRPSVRSRALAVGAGALAALAVWVVAVPLLGVDLTVVQGGVSQAVPAVATVVAALVNGLLGWGLLALLESRVRNGRRIWLGIAAAVVLLSLLGPILQAANAAAAATLVVMHLAVAAVVVPGLTRTPK